MDSSVFSTVMEKFEIPPCFPDAFVLLERFDDCKQKSRSLRRKTCSVSVIPSIEEGSPKHKASVVESSSTPLPAVNTIRRSVRKSDKNLKKNEVCTAAEMASEQACEKVPENLQGAHSHEEEVMSLNKRVIKNKLKISAQAFYASSNKPVMAPRQMLASTDFSDCSIVLPFTTFPERAVLDSKTKRKLKSLFKPTRINRKICKSVPAYVPFCADSKPEADLSNDLPLQNLEQDQPPRSSTDTYVSEARNGANPRQTLRQSHTQRSEVITRGKRQRASKINVESAGLKKDVSDKPRSNSRKRKYEEDSELSPDIQDLVEETVGSSQPGVKNSVKTKPRSKSRVKSGKRRKRTTSAPETLPMDLDDRELINNNQSIMTLPCADHNRHILAVPSSSYPPAVVQANAPGCQTLSSGTACSPTSPVLRKIQPNSSCPNCGCDLPKEKEAVDKNQPLITAFLQRATAVSSTPQLSEPRLDVDEPREGEVRDKNRELEDLVDSTAGGTTHVEGSKRFESLEPNSTQLNAEASSDNNVVDPARVFYQEAETNSEAVLAVKGKPDNVSNELEDSSRSTDVSKDCEGILLAPPPKSDHIHFSGEKFEKTKGHEEEPVTFEKGRNTVSGTPTVSDLILSPQGEETSINKLQQSLEASELCIDEEERNNSSLRQESACPQRVDPVQQNPDSLEGLNTIYRQQIQKCRDDAERPETPEHDAASVEKESTSTATASSPIELEKLEEVDLGNKFPNEDEPIAPLSATEELKGLQNRVSEGTHIGLPSEENGSVETHQNSETTTSTSEDFANSKETSLEEPQNVTEAIDTMVGSAQNQSTEDVSREAESEESDFCLILRSEADNVDSFNSSFIESPKAVQSTMLEDPDKPEDEGPSTSDSTADVTIEVLLTLSPKTNPLVICSPSDEEMSVSEKNDEKMEKASDFALRFQEVQDETDADAQPSNSIEDQENVGKLTAASDLKTKGASTSVVGNTAVASSSSTASDCQTPGNGPARESITECETLRSASPLEDSPQGVNKVNHRNQEKKFQDRARFSGGALSGASAARSVTTDSGSQLDPTSSNNTSSVGVAKNLRAQRSQFFSRACSSYGHSRNRYDAASRGRSYKHINTSSEWSYADTNATQKRDANPRHSRDPSSTNRFAPTQYARCPRKFRRTPW